VTWTKLDEAVLRSRKITRAVRKERMAWALWSGCLVHCGDEGTDGLISDDMVDDVADELHIKPSELERAIAALVEVGLWHSKDTAKACKVCRAIVRRVEPAGFYVHDFADWNPTEDQSMIPIEKLRWKRAQALKHDRALCEAIQTRDGGRCCYCDIEVDWRDRRGARGGTYDHLLPNLFEPNWGNTMENVATCCRKCNGEKKNRTPEEWLAAGGRPLLLDPRGLNGTRTRLGRDQVPTRSHGRTTRETERTGSGSGPDLVATRNPDRDSG
jgi:hypothetical protein